jgi:hypothetical protein
MARIVNAKLSTLIGTPKQLRELLDLLAGKGAVIVNLDMSNFVVLDKPLTQQQIEAALRIVPGAKR